METKKIVLIGDANVGKSTFVNLLKGEGFSNDYKPTLGVEVDPIRRGNKCFNIWDCSGNQYRGLGDGYYLKAQGAIVMCDPTHLKSIDNVAKWAHEFKRMVGENVPIVYVMNKSELIPKDWDREGFVEISCKNNENLEKVLSFF